MNRREALIYLAGGVATLHVIPEPDFTSGVINLPYDPEPFKQGDEVQTIVVDSMFKIADYRDNGVEYRCAIRMTQEAMDRDPVGVKNLVDDFTNKIKDSIQKILQGGEKANADAG